MRPMSIEEYEALTRHDRELLAGDGAEAPLFPMTERKAARVLADCGFKGADRWLKDLRDMGEIAATTDAWDRGAVVEAWKRMMDMEAVNPEVSACHAYGVPYREYTAAFLAACERVRDEFGDVVPVAGVFGRHELVSLESFVKVFHPVRGGADGVIPGRVEFRLADDTRAAFEAAKVK